MLISDKFGLVSIVLLLIAIICAFNAKVLDIEVFCKLYIVFANAAIVCFMAFVILSLLLA